MRALYLLLIIGTLSGCSSSPSEKVIRINKMIIPVIQNNSVTKSSSNSRSLSLYQENKLQIENVANTLKSDYLHDVKRDEMFDVHSQHTVYASLSKLEQMQQMNNFYYKEHNQTGLLSINQSVNSLIE